MADIFDYLKSCVDETFAQRTLSDADTLVFSRLAYLPFDGAIESGWRSEITVAQAAEMLLARDGVSEEVMYPRDLDFLRELARNRRFGQLGLSGYVNIIEQNLQMQFSAITLTLDKNLHYIVFRGTDTTFVGWKEDFNMSFTFPIPSQKNALDYIEGAADAFEGPLYVGGHSKGGNLAVYSAAFCRPETQARIRGVYNHDGPGFSRDVMSQSGYKNVAGKIHTFVPQSSVVGMLLDHEENYTIVESRQIGLMQHDLYTWQTEQNGFVCLDRVSESSRLADLTLKEWIGGMSDSQREAFSEALYSVLEGYGASTTRELNDNRYKAATAMLKTLKNMDPDTRGAITKTLSQLFTTVRKNIPVVASQHRKRQEQH